METLRPNGQTCSGAQNANPGALAASLVVMTHSGVVYRISMSNTNVAARYLQVFDAAAVPADGAVPLFSKLVAIGGDVELPFGVHGRAFGQGCVVVSSSTQATKTISAADALFDVQFKSA